MLDRILFVLFVLIIGTAGALLFIASVWLLWFLLSMIGG